jgi:hypothetical protein
VYDLLAIWAPVFLLLLRILQGVAVGSWLVVRPLTI